MRVLELIQDVEIEVSKSHTFPETLEMPLTLLRQFEVYWRTSEQEERELGGNLMAEWCYDSSTPYVSDLCIQNDEIYRGTDAGDTVAIPPVPAPTPDTTAEEYAEFRRNVADFHTHPSDPSPGRLMNSRGYQPPSIEDLRALLTKADRFIYISFVVACATEGLFGQTEIYAMVYIKGVSQPYDAEIENIKGLKDQQIKQLVFPTQEKEVAYVAKAQRVAQNLSGNESAEAANRKLKRSLAEDTIGYGERLAEIGLASLISACRVCNIGLYKGAQVLQKLV